MLRSSALPATLLGIALALCPAASRAGALDASASSPDGVHITFAWSYYEDPSNPTGHPEWIGYDVLRRSQADCGPFVRVNATPYPRNPGVNESFSFTETPAANATTYHYQVILVDAGRNQLFLGPQACDCSSHWGWASCPEFSAPIAHGTLTDLGWAVLIQPCPDECSSSFYISGAKYPALKPYAVSGEMLNFYGQAACGSIEGCALDLDHYEVAACAPTASRHTTWGAVKAIYR